MLTSRILNTMTRRQLIFTGRSLRQEIAIAHRIIDDGRTSHDPQMQRRGLLMLRNASADLKLMRLNPLSRPVAVAVEHYPCILNAA